MEQIIHALTLRKYTKYNILNKIYEEDILNKILHVAQNVKLNDDNDDDDDDDDDDNSRTGIVQKGFPQQIYKYFLRYSGVKGLI